MEVKIKKLNADAVIPQYAHDTDAGMDLTAISHEYDVQKGHIYGTGLAIEIPKGYVGLLFPRSSNRKTNAYLTNHVGVIDSGYRGEIMLTYKNRDDSPFDGRYKPYEVGDRVAQLIIIPYPHIELKLVDELEDSDRGINGHGSTGN